MKSLLHVLSSLIEQALEKRGLDARLCYTRVVTSPPDGREVRVEATDARVLEDVAAALGETGEVRVRFVALPEGGDAGADHRVAISSVVDVRRDPSHTCELRTQLIYGDAVRPLREEGDWVLVRLDDGYIGWICSWHLAAWPQGERARFEEAARHRIAVNHADVLRAPEPDALPVTDLVVGTRVIVSDCKKRGWKGVRLPDGKEGFVRARAVEPLARRRATSRERLAGVGLRFLGIPYLWGGTTPKGFDCSGLIQRIFRLCGRLVPRDADMQGRFGARRTCEDASELETGDLLFFGKDRDHITHVAMMLPDGLFLHAHGQVRVGSLDPRHPLYEPKLHRIWRFGRDPLG